VFSGWPKPQPLRASHYSNTFELKIPEKPDNERPKPICIEEQTSICANYSQCLSMLALPSNLLHQSIQPLSRLVLRSQRLNFRVRTVAMSEVDAAKAAASCAPEFVCRCSSCTTWRLSFVGKYLKCSFLFYAAWNYVPPSVALLPVRICVQGHVYRCVVVLCLVFMPYSRA
jgi:hypothetical protein